MDLKRPNKLRLSGKSGASEAPAGDDAGAARGPRRSTRSPSSSPT